jgi:hypothetical protein
MTLHNVKQDLSLVAIASAERKGGVLLLCCLLFAVAELPAQITLQANGPGSTYELIDAQFGSGGSSENPDCSHASFGRHITEVFDNELGKNVFVFHIHADVDNDRCTNFDRQRNEIKGGNGSSAGLKHTQGETAYTRWKFKLDAGFVPSSRFTHIMQIKALDGDAGAPLMTLTPRAGSPQKMEVIHSAGEGSGSQGKIAEVDLAPFKGTWVEAYMEYRNSEGSAGTFSLVIKRVSDGVTLLSVSRTGIDMWRTGASFNRPKWGIYRGLDDVLRDEQVRFADFCISESSASQCPSSVGGGGTLPSIPVGTTQAENLNKSGYETNTFEGVTCARAISTAPGYINGRFTGSTGTYNVTIRCFDENDGAATLTVRSNGVQIGSRTMNINDHTWKSWTINGVSLSNGHEIRIEGAHESGEHARVDYIQIAAATALFAEEDPSSEILSSYPNPSPNEVTIKYTVKKAGVVKLSVYNSISHETIVLVNEHLSAGKHEISFLTNRLPKGVHIIRMETDGKLTSEKLIKQ